MQINLQIERRVTDRRYVRGPHRDGRPILRLEGSWSSRSKTYAQYLPPIPCPGSAPKIPGGGCDAKPLRFVDGLGRMRRSLLLTLVIGATERSAHGASSLPPCAAGDVISPTVNFTDTAKGTTRLTATHPIQAFWEDLEQRRAPPASTTTTSVRRS